MTLRASLLVSAVFLCGAPAEPCDRELLIERFEAARIGPEYVIRTVGVEAGQTVKHPARIDGVVDILAREAGAIVTYAFPATTRDIQPTEWRGNSPLGVLREFAAAVGLAVAAPEPGVWLIGRPELVGQTTVRITVRPALPEQQSSLWGTDTAVVERALVRAFPVRRALGRRIAVDFEYLAVDEEDERILLVNRWLDHSEGTLRRWSSGLFAAFKVRVHRDEAGWNVECLWASLAGGADGAPEGPLIPEVAEDLDGDGYRDYYFLHGGSDRPDVILSGKDGSCLLRPFAVGELAVEAAEGPKRIAVRALWPDDDGASEIRDVGVLRWDREEGRFAVEPEATRASALQSSGGERYAPRVLAAVVGGENPVRAYVFYPAGLRDIPGARPIPAYAPVERFRAAGPELRRLLAPRVLVDSKLHSPGDHTK